MHKTLTDPTDIRSWTEARGGNPLAMDVPEPTGGTQTLLQLSFGQHALNADHNEGPDRPVGGFELVSWDDWLEAFERQGLALVVEDDLEAGRIANYRLMSRSEAGV